MATVSHAARLPIRMPALQLAQPSTCKNTCAAFATNPREHSALAVAVGGSGTQIVVAVVVTLVFF